MFTLAKILVTMSRRISEALKYDDLAAIQKQPWVNSATPAVSQNLRLRYGNIDVAASANGVSGDYFNVYGMTFSEGATFNAEQLARQSAGGRAGCKLP